MTLAEFTARAVGVPFRDKGRDWEGWDCWGLVCVFHRDVLGVDLPSHLDDYAEAGATASSRKRVGTVIAASLDRYRRIAAPDPGDVAVLNVGGRPVHVGLIVDAGRLLHAERRIGTVIERLASSRWCRRVEGFYRHA